MSKREDQEVAPEPMAEQPLSDPPDWEQGLRQTRQD